MSETDRKREWKYRLDGANRRPDMAQCHAQHAIAERLESLVSVGDRIAAALERQADLTEADLTEWRQRYELPPLPDREGRMGLTMRERTAVAAALDAAREAVGSFPHTEVVLSLLSRSGYIPSPPPAPALSEEERGYMEAANAYIASHGNLDGPRARVLVKALKRLSAPREVPDAG